MIINHTYINKKAEYCQLIKINRTTFKILDLNNATNDYTKINANLNQNNKNKNLSTLNNSNNNSNEKKESVKVNNIIDSIFNKNIISQNRYIIENKENKIENINYIENNIIIDENIEEFKKIKEIIEDINISTDIKINYINDISNKIKFPAYFSYYQGKNFYLENSNIFYGLK